MNVKKNATQLLTDDELDNVVGGSHISSGDIAAHVGETRKFTYGFCGMYGGMNCEIIGVGTKKGSQYVIVRANPELVKVKDDLDGWGCTYDEDTYTFKIPYDKSDMTYFE